MPVRLKRWIFRLVSLALAVGLLALLFSRQNWSSLAQRLETAKWPWLLAAAVTSGAYWLVKSARWKWVARLEGQRIRLRRACISMLAGLGVGLLTPFRGGEVIRPMFIAPGARVRLAGWVIIERLFDLSAVLMLSMLGLAYVIAANLPVMGDRRVGPDMLPFCPVLLALALGPPLLVHYRPLRLWLLLARLLPRWARELAQVYLGWREFAIFLATSLAGELLSVVAVYFCMRAFGDIGLLAALALVPVVMLHNLLPATPGGFGVREGFAVLVFGLFGFAEEMVLAAYLTDALLVLVIPGAVGLIAAWVAGVIKDVRKLEAPRRLTIDD